MITVSSMRLDAIVSDLIRVSRAKALPMIRSGQCRVNWRLEEDPSSLLEEGDVLSIRGHGRFKVLAVEGTTRKGNIRDQNWEICMKFLPGEGIFIFLSNPISC